MPGKELPPTIVALFRQLAAKHKTVALQIGLVEAALHDVTAHLAGDIHGAPSELHGSACQRILL